jgi:hypothetical protein
MATKLKGKEPTTTIKPGHLKAIIFAESGVGKTWLSLMFPANYFCDIEGGARLSHYQKRLKESGGVYFGPEDGSNDPTTLLTEIRTLGSEKHNFKTLTLDSVTKVYNTIIGKEAERLGDKDAFGASKKPAIAFIRSLINALDKVEMNCFLICHEKAKWSNGEQIGFEENMWDGLRYELDLAIRLVNRGGKRMAIVIKSRLEAFPISDTFEATYEEIVSRYGRDFIEAPAVPVALATAEQIAEINRLLEIVKVDEKEVAKWHSKAKADSFSEYKSEDLQKLINHLKEKVK